MGRDRRESGHRIVEVGTDFRTTSLDVLSRARLTRANTPTVLRSLAQRGIPEIALLATCNRLELYAASDEPDETIAVLEEEIGSLLGGDRDVVETVVRRDGETVGHLVAVAAGLESALLGEHEILGQVRQARAMAVEAGTAGDALDELFEHALRHGRRVRRALGISNVRRSLTDVAAEWLAGRLADPERSTAVVVGAGETAAQMASHLRALRIGALTVANRSVARSRELAAAVDANAVPLDRLHALLARADVLVLATSAPEPVVRAGLVEAALAERGSDLLVVDLGLAPNAEREVFEHPRIVALTLNDVVALALAEANPDRALARHAHALVREAVAAFRVSGAQEAPTARAASTV